MGNSCERPERGMESGMISVDKWSSGSQAYFLTHLHADHTVGLSSAWKHGLLFCSRLTSRLFPCKFPDFDLSLLRVLRVGSWHSITLTTPSSGAPTQVYVKPIDAHHCPGSVMYLFRGKFGYMLYTGDFRWEAAGNEVQSGRTMLLDSLKKRTLNTLHLDNTYCNPRYSFPSREVASKQVVDIITSHPDHDVIIAIDSLGKEDLLLYISRTLNIKVWVWPERLQIMHILGFRSNFTTQTTVTRVRAVPRYSFTTETLEGLNKTRRTIGIMPSGLPWPAKAKEKSVNVFGSSSCSERTAQTSNDDSSNDTISLEEGSIKRYGKYIYVVPYSAHSCFSEIKDFVELLRPINIKGIVSSASCHIDPCYYFDHLCGTQQAFWRSHQKPDNEDQGGNTVEDDVREGDVHSPYSVVRRKKRAMEFFRVSRVQVMRRRSHGSKITDAADDDDE
ncbi:uncharacterized protein LOC127254281 [Andrographis paniculata]|uniref:uncharacterized protein LOC127254281 n=1 Tax=Andrographis paniculata TaxID=175694 RepID=UPI0021E96DE4|nr:uncharacterized protein LOC127254281 [Andrographis paniculata]